MLGREVERKILKSGFQSVFGIHKDLIRDADHIVANLEAPFVNSGLSFKNKNPHMTFKINTKLAEVLNCFKMSVTLANNHITDYGVEGVKSTCQTLNEFNLKYTGAGIDIKEATRPIIFLDKQKKKIGIFAFNAFVPFTIKAKERSGGVAQFDHKTITFAMNNYSDNCDSIIIALHWGVDYHEFPIPNLLKKVQNLIDTYPKIIAVIGHHPHLQQPILFHKGRPIFCSLGNYVFDEPFKLSRIGSVLKLNFENGLIKDYLFEYTNLNENYELVKLSESELKHETSRIEKVKSLIEKNSNEFRKMDKKWIKYLIYQTLRYRSLNDLKYLMELYGIKGLIRNLTS